MINPNTNFSLSLKEIAGAVIGLTSLFGVYFTLQSDVANATTAIEELKTNSVQKIEFTFKDELIRESIKHSQLQIDHIEQSVNEINETVKKLEERIYELTK